MLHEERCHIAGIPAPPEVIHPRTTSLLATIEERSLSVRVDPGILKRLASCMRLLRNKVAMLEAASMTEEIAGDEKKERCRIITSKT